MDYVCGVLLSYNAVLGIIHLDACQLYQVMIYE